MIWFKRLTCDLGTIATLLAHTALAQSPATGSISGHILSEEGHTVRANVTLSFASARGFPSPPRRTLTDGNGAFSFTRLTAGSYVLCAQVTPSEAAPANSPFVDTCVWRPAQTPMELAPGQQLAGVVFTAPRGAWLEIRAADPDHVLPQAVPARGPAVLEPELQLMIKGPDGLYWHARFVSQDGAGRNYQMAVPLRTALGLKIASSVANVVDSGGSEVKDEVGFQPGTPADLNPMTFTLHRKGS